jgi:hypothetical protein
MLLHHVAGILLQPLEDLLLLLAHICQLAGMLLPQQVPTVGCLNRLVHERLLELLVG